MDFRRLIRYGKCGVAVIRVSGPKALVALQKMTKISSLKPRIAFLRKICDPETKEVLDKGLCLWFPGPNSFTGEDSAEFHVHGGPAVVTSVLNALSKLRFHLALPGEFTKRAFLNGKIDLTEAEGIGDLIEAETEKQRKQAANQANGSLRHLYDSWHIVLLNVLANLEAYIDFSEEHRTTRDVIELTTNICGYPMILADTAGIRNNPENEIEVEGIRKAKKYSKEADFVICVISAENKIKTSLKTFLKQYKSYLEIDKKRVLTVLNKVDLLKEEEKENWRKQNVVLISCKTQEGLTELTNALGECFKEICGDPCKENPVLSHARYRNHLLHVSYSLELYLQKTTVPNYDMAISLQDIRNAARELGKITGSISNEEVLDIIFKNFCIGK
ncbi:tRNA modification GTPase MnmE [Melipona quadrifasciata]|uniref:tRNA modification GTPase MnmE n=1 Tax=Melipona quadrifasciata TaxID=166423 RepID=A0A0M9A2J6_9HYME|nr:tRNA modification GTPase MnmE [Melipona quadrifasciata]